MIDVSIEEIREQELEEIREELPEFPNQFSQPQSKVHQDDMLNEVITIEKESQHVLETLC